MATVRPASSQLWPHLPGDPRKRLFTLSAAQTDPPQPVIAPLAQPITPTRLTIRNGTASEVVLQGLSLIDRRTGSHTSITVSPNGDFRRIHSGDVKIYERLGAPGRAWLVHGVTPVRDATEAQAAIAGPTFAPAPRPSSKPRCLRRRPRRRSPAKA